MNKYIPGNQKHLTLEDRIYIENALDKGCPFKVIDKYLCKDPTTISEEVKTHRLSDWLPAPDLIKLLTSAMAVTRKSTTIPSHTNINMMSGLQAGKTV